MVSAVHGTKKCQDAEAKGVTVVDEDWVRNRIAGSGSKKVKNAPAAVAAPPVKKAKTGKSAPTESEGEGNSLSGLVFAITGSMRSSPSAFVYLHFFRHTIRQTSRIRETHCG